MKTDVGDDGRIHRHYPLPETEQQARSNSDYACMVALRFDDLPGTVVREELPEIEPWEPTVGPFHRRLLAEFAARGSKA